MNEPPQTGKRIVSKGEYLQVQSKRLGLVLKAVFFCVAAMSLLAAAMFYAVLTFAFIYTPSYIPTLPLPVQGITANLIFSVLMLTLGGLCYKIGLRTNKRLENMEMVQPITRANTADLSAPDSLVRASAEPMEAQEAVLLRAAEGQETPPEQLVRTVGGNKES